MASRMCDSVIVGSAAALLLVLAIGGIDYEWGPLQLRIQSVPRPLTVLLTSLALGGWVLFRTAGSLRPFLERSATYVASRGLAALLLAIALIYVEYHVRVCGGLDSYGYVSTASLLASGKLREAQPLAALLPFDGAASAAAPLGYLAAPDGQSQVPRFPLGLPAVMALFRVFGPLGPFFVPLVLSLLTLWLVYLLAREPDMPVSGLFATALIAVDPVFVDAAIEPLSDAPAAFWLIAALWMRLARPQWPILAGICAGMAFLTRPVLVIAVAALIVLTPARSRTTVRFGSTVGVFLLLQLVVHAVLYGSPWNSGYGSASYLFQVSRIPGNLWNFAKWITYSHTALLWIAWPIALFVLRRRRRTWQLSGIAAAAALPYVFYFIFEDPSRFLLPALILVLAVTARGLSTALASKLSAPAAGIVLLIVAFACAAGSHQFLRNHGVYDFGRLEAKYPLVGEWFSSHTTAGAVVLSALHSGSIRYYGSRQTIRWDQIPPGRLVPTLVRLREHGYPTYLALDLPSEPDLFNDRFRNELRLIRMTPLAHVRVVNIYAIESQ